MGRGPLVTVVGPALAILLAACSRHGATIEDEQPARPAVTADARVLALAFTALTGGRDIDPEAPFAAVANRSWAVPRELAASHGDHASLSAEQRELLSRVHEAPSRPWPLPPPGAAVVPGDGSEPLTGRQLLDRSGAGHALRVSWPSLDATDDHAIVLYEVTTGIHRRLGLMSFRPAETGHWQLAQDVVLSRLGF